MVPIDTAVCSDHCEELFLTFVNAFSFLKHIKYGHVCERFLGGYAPQACDQRAAAVLQTCVQLPLLKDGEQLSVRYLCTIHKTVDPLPSHFISKDTSFYAAVRLVIQSDMAQKETHMA